MNQFTEIVFILDCSGSMAGLEKDTIGGFNSLLKKQRKEKGRAVVSTVLFNHTMKVLHDRKDINKVSLLDEKDYCASGCTAMLDAIGRSIHHIGNVHKYANRKDRPDKTLFVITTDGMENASKEYSYERVKRMIERQKKLYDWEFLFLGANIDAGLVGERFGVERNRSVNYINDEDGVSCFYSAVNETICNYREKGVLKDDWAKSVEEDYKKRNM